MRTELSISPAADFDRMWNLLDRFWMPRDFESVGAFPIDVYKQDDRLIVQASLPGVKLEDIKLNIEQGVLTISAETREDIEDKSRGRVYHREHRYGKLFRSVRLPAEVDENKVEGELDNGMLMVSMPLKKPEEQPPRQIPIHTKNDEHQTTGSGAYADRPQNQQTGAAQGNQGGTGNDGKQAAASSASQQPNSTRY